MKRLGISGRDRYAAAALAVDGRVVAAVAEDAFARVPAIGYALTGGLPSAAVGACLASAGLTVDDLDEVAVVSDSNLSGLSSGPDPGGPPVGRAQIRPVETAQADAVQAAASTRERVVLIFNTDAPQVATFTRRDDGGLRVDRVEDGRSLVAAARSLARHLGLSGGDPCGALDRLSVGGEPEYVSEMAAAISWKAESGVVADGDRLVRFAVSLDGGSLAEAALWNTRLQRTRRALAASFTCRVAQVIHEVAGRARASAGAESIAFGGTMFANTRLNTELRRLDGPLSLAAVPEATGRALGAALATTSGPAGALAGLALGPSFSDADIKRTLDNCRLDSVYEPDRPRIFERVSKLLAQGKVVAWFQGAMAFGPRSLGTRSVLCDPSGRYARQNVNEYLRQVAVDEPLPVVFAPSVAQVCIDESLDVGSGVYDAPVVPAWRGKLGSALDWRSAVRVHASSVVEGDLPVLVETHYRRTGVPGLIETNLCGPGEPIACTPRDAVRTVYSSAIDALVIGGFILMKDYWLLRADS